MATPRPRSIPPGSEIYLPFPVPRTQLRDATEFRTTWLASSLTALRERGLFDRYLAELPRSYHELVSTTVVGDWVSVQVAMEHYGACQRLGLSVDETEEISRSVTKRVHGTSLQFILRLAKQSGASPWTVLGQLNRLWERVWRGGGVCVHRLGPKDALVEIAGWPPSRIGYVQIGMPPLVQSLLELFARRVYAQTVPDMTSVSSIGLHASWV